MAISNKDLNIIFGVDVGMEKITQSYGNFMVIRSIECLKDRIESFANKNCSGDKINVCDVFRILNDYEGDLRKSFSNVKGDQ